ncbi:MAG: Rpn family recombination-promoting nuclease/putative transposase [Bacteroidales bacterium]|nr:Rpn family recombination-promoting nuclease/putative transposase [Bacteroidales bacterium]
MKPLSEATIRQYIAEGNKIKNFRKLSEEKKEQIVEQVLSTEFLDLRCDWAFKYVLSDPELLLILLNDFLPENIVSISSITNEPKRLNGSEKNVLMDVVARTETGQEIVIEMQRFKKTDLRARLFYYGAAMVRSQLKRGRNYGRLKPVYVLCFMDFRMRHLGNQLVYRYRMIEQDSHEEYGDWLSIYLCELPRLKKVAMSEMNYIEGWMHIIRESSTFAEKPEGMDERFDRVVEAARLQKVPENDKMDYFKAMVSDNERLEYGEDRYAEGRAEGAREKQIEIALRMVNEFGQSPAKAAEITGLKVSDFISD